MPRAIFACLRHFFMGKIKVRKFTIIECLIFKIYIMNKNEKMTVFSENSELAANQIKETLPLMLQHVVRFYDMMCPKEFSGEARLLTIKVINWAWQTYNGHDVMASENVRDGLIHNDEVCRNMPQILRWKEALDHIKDLDSLSDENITKPALRQSGLLSLPLIIKGESMLEPRDYYIDQFMKACKGSGIH